jgi:alkanesulfonate monooxygenase SsuD/methylene tetrahydromethanopterin reductase-like flavin-dependent oxidoreductase (luciferase family)
MARLGAGMLIIPQKPWKEVENEMDAYRATYREVNGAEAPPPIAAGWVFCDENADRARELAHRHIGGYFQSVLEHYEFAADHLARTKGYEYYGKMADKIHTYGTSTVIDYFVDLQVWGTPEECRARIADIHQRVGNSHFIGVFGYADMPTEEAERSMRLFSRAVMPEVKEIGGDAGSLGRPGPAGTPPSRARETASSTPRGTDRTRP